MNDSNTENVMKILSAEFEGRGKEMGIYILFGEPKMKDYLLLIYFKKEEVKDLIRILYLVKEKGLPFAIKRNVSLYKPTLIIYGNEEELIEISQMFKDGLDLELLNESPYWDQRAYRKVSIRAYISRFPLEEMLKRKHQTMVGVAKYLIRS